MNGISLCDGSRPRPCHICIEVNGMVHDVPNTCICFDSNHNISNCCYEAGQRCTNQVGLLANQCGLKNLSIKIVLDQLVLYGPLRMYKPVEYLSSNVNDTLSKFK